MTTRRQQTLISLQVNGTVRALPIDPDTPLLYILRNDFALNGPKFGCGLGQCGACNVIIDGIARRSCVLPAGAAEGKHVITLEGLGTLDKPHPIQQAFIDEQAAQCGYCLNGMIITTKALLDRNPDPVEDEVRQALAGNLCRCGAHVEVLRAIARAAAVLRKRRPQ
jgi:nicotinate dehydrogenase subunit A